MRVGFTSWLMSCSSRLCVYYSQNFLKGEMRYLNIILLTFFVVSCGCAPKQKSLAELDAVLKSNERASVREYVGKTPEEVRAAAQRVLYLLDPSDMKFDVQSDKLLATRWGFYYNIFSVMTVRDWYEVDMRQAGSNTVVKFTYENGPLEFMGSVQVSFKSNIPVSARNIQADFELFHDRVEYVLGIRKSWPTCKDALAKNEGSYLCNSLGVDDKKPDWDLK